MQTANATEYAVIVCHILLMIGVGFMRFDSIALRLSIFAKAAAFHGWSPA